MNIEDFVKTETSEYDESHDFNHALAVVNNTKTIAIYTILSDLDDDDFDSINVLIMAAYLHDVCDHKYDNSEEKQNRLYEYINQNSTEKEATVIIDIIENMSFSKQRDLKTKDLGIYQILLNIVSDADKLEAIGQVGIDRCIAYTKTLDNELVTEQEPDGLLQATELVQQQEKNISELVKKHCYDKLLLLKDQYIRTSKGKKWLNHYIK